MDMNGAGKKDISLDDMLRVLENTTRRSILTKLTKESHYPLQLSRKLNISQQLVMKHLKVLEDAGFVTSRMVKSPEGPPRKLYLPAAHFTIEIYLSPDTFRAEVKDQNAKMRSQLPAVSDAGTRDAGEKIIKFSQELERCINTLNSRERLKRVSELVHDLNEEIYNKESQRDMLLKLKSIALRLGREVIGEMCPDYTTRSVLYYYIEKDSFNVDALSEELNIRIKLIEEAIGQLFDESKG